jgi:hypothetical protein
MLFQKVQTLFKSRNAINLCLVSAVWLFVSACVFSTGKEAGKVDSNSQTNNSNALPAAPSTRSNYEKSDKQADAGDFIVRHLSTDGSRYRDLEQKVKKEKLLEKAADDLNRTFVLPNNIYLQSKSCGTANADFDPETQAVTVCYELMEHFSKLFVGDGLKPAAADKKMFDAVRFAFLHEVGHALIHNYKLPIAGNEEDAADRCSSYINIEELGESGVSAVLAAADAFRIESKQKTSAKSDLSDEHLLQEQRFYNSLCMIYGSDSDKYEYFVKDGYLPRARAERCPVEYQRTVVSWTNLLQPWRKSSD